MRTRIISPRTPRSSGRSGRAPKPRQSTTTPASGPSAEPSAPKRNSTPASTQAFDQRAHRRARIDVAFAGEEEPFAESPGEIRLERGDSPFVDARVPSVRAAKRSISSVSRGGATTSVPCAHHAGHMRLPPVDRPGAELDHGGRGALSPSQNGASMPPASQDALPPKLRRALDERDRSRPRSANVSAVARPTTPGADDGRRASSTPPRSHRARRPGRRIRAISPPCRPSPRPPCADPA